MSQVKLLSCPECGSKNDEGHEHCFHCLQCGYLQCVETLATRHMRWGEKLHKKAEGVVREYTRSV